MIQKHLKNGTTTMVIKKVAVWRIFSGAIDSLLKKRFELGLSLEWEFSFLEAPPPHGCGIVGVANRWPSLEGVLQKRKLPFKRKIPIYTWNLS
tara:strand:+ start:56215 stop:56493 length:279 start_codon:yes stop_codon:yes gene_type:complete